MPFEVCRAWRGCLAAHDECAMIVSNSSSISLYGGRKKEKRSEILGGHYYIKESRVSFCGSGPLTKIQKPLDRLHSRIPVIYRSGLGHSRSPFRLRPILHADNYIPIIHAFPTPPQRSQSCPLFGPLRAAGLPTNAFCGKSEQALLGSQSTRVHRICGGNTVNKTTMLLGSPLACTTYVILVIIVAAYIVHNITQLHHLTFHILLWMGFASSIMGKSQR